MTTFIQFTPADMQSAIAPANTPPPPPVPNESRPTFNFSTQAPAGPGPAPPILSGSKPKGMQLGSHKASGGVFPGGLGGEEEVRWDGDLMDVNADADDWSTYTPSLTKTHN